MSLSAETTPVGLDTILSTPLLARRPSRKPDYEAESAAIQTLMTRMTQGPDALMSELTNVALQLWNVGVWAECGGFDATNASQGSDAPVEEIEQAGPGAGGCDPSYPTVCVPRSR